MPGRIGTKAPSTWSSGCRQWKQLCGSSATGAFCSNLCVCLENSHIQCGELHSVMSMTLNLGLSSWLGCSQQTGATGRLPCPGFACAGGPDLRSSTLDSAIPRKFRFTSTF